VLIWPVAGKALSGENGANVALKVRGGRGGGSASHQRGGEEK
jgi:hypothetical protein